jgi:integrase
LSELTTLDWSQIDLNKRLIHIQNTDTFTTKTKKNRVIPISDMVVEALGDGGTGLVFRTWEGHAWTLDYVSHRFRRCIRKAGLPTRYHFHTLRHTFASWLAQEGVSIYEIGQLLGHASVTTTQIYAHLQPQKLHATVNRIILPMN